MRIHRAFSFIDLSGFTNLTEVEGDEKAVAVLSRFRGIVREVCARRGVRIDKWLGDGAMLVDVDAEPMVAAILELTLAIERSDLQVTFRSGITAGDVLLHEGDDYIGHAVNVAARLCDVAKGGEVLAESTVLDAVPAWGRVAATNPVQLHGLEAPIPVSRLELAIHEGEGVAEDPICGVPLTSATAMSSDRDAAGMPVLFCSASCQETWTRRPRPEVDPLGSPRSPLMH